MQIKCLNVKPFWYVSPLPTDIYTFRVYTVDMTGMVMSSFFLTEHTTCFNQFNFV